MEFDLIHGMMTVEYDEGVVWPGDLVRSVAERTGMEATLQGEATPAVPAWWSVHQRQVLTAGSGLALALGLAVSWLAPALGMDPALAPPNGPPVLSRGRGHRGCRAVSTGYPQSFSAALRYRRPHGTGDPGRAGTRGLVGSRDSRLSVWTVGTSRSVEPFARRSIQRFWSSPRPRPSGSSPMARCERSKPAGSIVVIGF